MLAYCQQLVEKVKSGGVEKMQHFLGWNLEDRGGITHIKTVAQIYVNSLRGLALDQPPSCHVADMPGQGTAARDVQLRKDKADVEILQELSTHKFAQTTVNTCNSCTHDIPPTDRKYGEMEDVAFKAQTRLKILPGYQETMPIMASLPAEGMVLLESSRKLYPPTLAMPYTIGNMFTRYGES